MYHPAWYPIAVAAQAQAIYEWPEGLPFRIDVMFEMAIIYLFGGFAVAVVVVAAIFVLKSGRPILWGFIVGGLLTAAAFQVVTILEALR